MKAKYSIVAACVASLLPLTVAASPGNPGTGPAVAEECRQMRASAQAMFSEPPQFGEDSSPARRARKMLGEAVGVCRRASESARDPELAAEMKAEEYLARATLAPSRPRPGEQGRGEVLLEGIEKIRGLHGDHSPASIILLRKAGHRLYEEDPEYGQELLELAVEIARGAFGETDPRYADELRNLALLYAPRPQREGSDWGLWQPDPKKAESLLREALGIYLLDDTVVGGDGYRSTVLVLQRLYEATGRETEAEEMRAALDESYDDSRRMREAKALEEAGEPPADPKE